MDVATPKLGDAMIKCNQDGYSLLAEEPLSSSWCRPRLKGDEAERIVSSSRSLLIKAQRVLPDASTLIEKAAERLKGHPLENQASFVPREYAPCKSSLQI